MKDRVELFHAFTIDEIQDRRQLFASIFIDPSDTSSNLGDLCDWIFGFQTN